MAKVVRKVREKTSIFDKREEIVTFLEKTFVEVTYKAIIDKKLNILHEYYSNGVKISHTEYFYDKKDLIEKIKFRHKLVLVDNN